MAYTIFLLGWHSLPFLSGGLILKSLPKSDSTFGVAGNRLSSWEASLAAFPFQRFGEIRTLDLELGPSLTAGSITSQERGPLPLGTWGWLISSQPSPPPLSLGNTALTAGSGSVQCRPEPPDLQRPDWAAVPFKPADIGYQAGTAAAFCFYGLVSQ